MSSNTNDSQPESHPGNMDLRAIFKAIWLPFLAWASAVNTVAFAGRQPGVVCATPVAWLLACWVGMSCVSRSRSMHKATLLKEAALAGGILGLLQGLLFLVVTPFMGDIKPDERQKAVFLIVAMIVVGTLVCAVLSMVVGAGQANRRGAK